MVFSCQQLKVAYWEVKGQGEQAHQQSSVQKKLCTKRETDKWVKKEALWTHWQRFTPAQIVFEKGSRLFINLWGLFFNAFLHFQFLKAADKILVFHNLSLQRDPMLCIRQALHSSLDLTTVVALGCINGFPRGWVHIVWFGIKVIGDIIGSLCPYQNQIEPPPKCSCCIKF